MAEINPSVGAAYGGGQQIEPRIQALEGSYTHFRAHETVLNLVSRPLLEKKKKK